jgi:predicted deacylase
MFISAAIHGDEINGVEIIKRVLRRPILKKLKGTLIAVPIVNVFGYNNRSRYLPDRRDLNRSFPGTKEGSLASRLAYIFMKEVVEKCDYGIDLHTGALHRTNIPHIRACLDDKKTKSLAQEFGVPVLIHSKLRDGSLREAARKKKIPMLLYEGGEALRFREDVIRIGVYGCLSVMRKVKLLPPIVGPAHKPQGEKSFVARGSYWVRAPHSGSFTGIRKVGDHVQEGDELAVISDPFGREAVKCEATSAGIIIGMATIPLVNRGDAMFHIASFKNSTHVKKALATFEDGLIF